MIREDIKQKLINEDLDKLFLPHRIGIDQANYRVGIVFNEIIAWNPDTNIFMDYFYDDYPDIIWFELSLVYNEGNGYKINRSGEVLGPSGRIIAKLYDAWGYINYKIHVSKNKKAHIFMAKMFVPNIDPDNKIFVDHIDRDKNNILPTNLRWVTSKENANNLYRPKHTNRVSNAIFRAYSDKERTHLVKEYFGAESLEAAYPDRNNVIHTIQDSIKGRISKGKKNNGKRLFYSFEKLSSCKLSEGGIHLWGIHCFCPVFSQAASINLCFFTPSTCYWFTEPILLFFNCSSQTLILLSVIFLLLLYYFIPLSNKNQSKNCQNQR